MEPLQLLNHKAYTDLPPSAAKALPLFLAKPKRPYTDPEHCEVSFTFPYQEARKRHGFSLSTFAKVISDLMSYGFIDPVDKGGLRGDRKSGNVFKLSNRWEKYGTTEFKEVLWKEFQPPIPAARNSRI